MNQYNPNLDLLFWVLFTKYDLVKDVIEDNKDDNGDGNDNDGLDSNLEILWLLSNNLCFKTTFLEHSLQTVHSLPTNNVFSPRK